MDMEEWKDIEGFEGKYQVSNMGNVKSLNFNRTGKEKLLNPCMMNTGYFTVALRKEGKTRQCFLVHRLVAKAFIPNPMNLPCINHKSEIKTDNTVGNLEWCTYEYNNNYGTHNSRMAESKKGTMLNRSDLSRKVAQFDLNENIVGVFPSAQEATRKTGISRGNISMCCLGKRKSAGGFIWRYA